MSGDPCMFCGEISCECTEKKAPLKRKPLSKKSDPVAEKKDKLAPSKVSKPLQPDRSLKRETTVDSELLKVLRTLDYVGILHDVEKKKYDTYLQVPPTTGRLLEADTIDEGGGEEVDG